MFGLYSLEEIIALKDEFHIVSEDKWLLQDDIGVVRKGRLLSYGTYKKLLNEMARKATIKFHKRERCRDYPSYYRVVVHLELSTKLVDLFHNSNFGYRAQYFLDKKNGENTNRYALNVLTPIILNQLRKKHKYTCQPDWVEKSLNEKFSKMWIHQGEWMLKKKKSDRNLLVNRWQSVDLDKLDKKSKKRVIWATLTPEYEKMVDVMGTFIKSDGTNLKKDLKPLRSSHLYNLGFT